MNALAVFLGLVCLVATIATCRITTFGTRVAPTTIPLALFCCVVSIANIVAADHWLASTVWLAAAIANAVLFDLAWQKRRVTR